MDRSEIPAMQKALERIASAANTYAHMANVGAMETAGALVSYLDNHPNDVEPFLAGGMMELPADWFERGWLTWQGQNGKVVTPEFARHARIIKRITKSNQDQEG